MTGLSKRGRVGRWLAEHSRGCAAGVLTVAVAGGGVAVWSQAADRPAVATAEVAENSRRIVHTDVVDFYRKVCRAVAPVVDGPDRVSRVVEDTIGEPVDSAWTRRAGVVAEIAGTTRAAVDGLRGIDAPAGVPSPETPRGVDFAPGVGVAADRVADAAGTLDAAAGPGPGDADQARLSETTGRWQNQVGHVAGEASAALADLFGADPVPNSPTMDRIRASAECASLLDDHGVADGTVSDSAVELWGLVDAAVDGPGSVTEALDGFSDLDGQGQQDVGQAGAAVADRFERVADAARRHAGAVARWDRSRPGTPVGYPAAADRWTADLSGVAGRAEEAGRSWRQVGASGDVAGWNGLVDRLSGQVSDLGDELSRARVRFGRDASVPNQATAEAIDAARGSDGDGAGAGGG